MARTAQLEIESPVLDNAEEELADPRDISPKDIAAVITWALANAPWPPFHRRLLQALYVENGDCMAVARIMGANLHLVEKLLQRAKSEVIMATKELYWQQDFANQRVLGGWPHRCGTSPRFPSRTIWFAKPEPKIVDWQEVVLWRAG